MAMRRGKKRERERNLLTKGICETCVAEEMGQGVPEGRLRPLLLPLRGRLLERRRVPRGQDRRKD